MANMQLWRESRTEMGLQGPEIIAFVVSNKRWPENVKGVTFGNWRKFTQFTFGN